jgi:dihydrodipicolinate synthase/N-acetylneuraminate lyase
VLTINPILEKIFSAPLVPPTRKVLALCGFPSGSCIAPRRPLTSAEEMMIEETVATMPAVPKPYLIKA